MHVCCLIGYSTGTSSGIGYDAALRLAKAGYVVYATVRRDRDGELLRSGDSTGRVRPVIMDVTQSRTIEDAANLIRVSRVQYGGLERRLLTQRICFWSDRKSSPSLGCRLWRW
jgi:hypothetical protein